MLAADFSGGTVIDSDLLNRFGAGSASPRVILRLGNSAKVGGLGVSFSKSALTYESADECFGASGVDPGGFAST